MSYKEAELFYSHEIITTETNVNHSIYSSDMRLAPDVKPEEIPRIINPVCERCQSLADLTSVTKSMRDWKDETQTISVLCSIQAESAVMESRKPRYINSHARCQLIEKGLMKKE